MVHDVGPLVDLGAIPRAPWWTMGRRTYVLGMGTKGAMVDQTYVLG